MSLLWFYFVFSERLTTWYGNESSEMTVFWLTQRGTVCSAVLDHGRSATFMIPFPILAIKKFRTITGTVIASADVVMACGSSAF